MSRLVSGMITLVFMGAQQVNAHPGHGSFRHAPDSVLHYTTEPVHLGEWVLLGVIVALVGQIVWNIVRNTPPRR